MPDTGAGHGSQDNTAPYSNEEAAAVLRRLLPADESTKRRVFSDALNLLVGQE